MLCLDHCEINTEAAFSSSLTLLLFSLLTTLLWLRAYSGPDALKGGMLTPGFTRTQAFVLKWGQGTHPKYRQRTYVLKMEAVFNTHISLPWPQNRTKSRSPKGNKAESETLSFFTILKSGANSFFI